eukprot:m.193980 g.193980  ORF g.193980 m.193980 type:complete len:568 (+) comp18643_c0_seq2:61-1764(+)
MHIPAWMVVVVATQASRIPAAPHGPVVTTDCGDVRGACVIERQTGVALNWFKDIPYGNASQRWQPPEPAVCWPGVRDATNRRGICWQINGHTRPPNNPWQQREDCLTLDVIVSSKHTLHNGTLPVIVWLYGGSLVAGSTDSYPHLERLAALEEIVLVVPNYRLGAFGFLTLPDLDTLDPRNVSGNYGLLDQQLSLRWVQHNIAAFGGDASRVTLLGQSSGGTSILALLASPASRTLFHAAISLSASPNITIDRVSAQKTFTAAVDATTNCSSHPQGIAKCLLALPPEAISSLLPATFDVEPALPRAPCGMHYPGLPIVDGVTVVCDVRTALARRIIDVPLLLQTAYAEMDTYENNVTIDAMSRASYNNFLSGWLRGHGFMNATSLTGEIDRLYTHELQIAVELGYQVFLAEYSFLCGNLALAKTAASAFSSPVYASVGMHAPCRPLTVFSATAAAPSRFSGHNWDFIAAIRSWDFYAEHFGAAAPYQPCANDSVWGDHLRHQWIDLSRIGSVPSLVPVRPHGVPSRSPYMVNLQYCSGPEHVVSYGATRCTTLANSLGLDERFWLTN